MEKNSFRDGPVIFPAAAITLVILAFACGQDSKVDCDKAGATSQCIEKTDDEKSVILLNEEKTDEAIELLERLRKQDPEKYYRHVRLASAYASKAKLDFFQIAESVQSGGSGGAASLAPDLTSDNKDSVYNKVFHINKAIEVLEAIPPGHRKKSSDLSAEERSERFYSGSAFTQLFMYVAVHTQICEKTLRFVATNLTEKYALAGEGKARSCGPLDILGNLGTVLSQVEGCDICSKLSSKITEIQGQFNDVVGSETDFDEATTLLLDKFCQDKQAQSSDDLQCPATQSPPPEEG